MKNRFLSILIFSIAFLSALTFNINSSRPSINKDIQTGVYVGDTDNGAVGAYAVYATSNAVGASVTSVYQYSTKKYFTATGYTYSKGQLSANLTASNGYSWNGPLVQ